MFNFFKNNKSKQTETHYCVDCDYFILEGGKGGDFCEEGKTKKIDYVKKLLTYTNTIPEIKNCDGKCKGFKQKTIQKKEEEVIN